MSEFLQQHIIKMSSAFDVLRVNRWIKKDVYFKFIEMNFSISTLFASWFDYSKTDLL